MDDNLQFDRVEQPAGATACSACQGALVGAYFQANGQVLCQTCAENVRQLFAEKDGGFLRLMRAVALGIGGGIAGGAVYVGVLKFAHINAALVTILIGWLVGKGVRNGSGARGGVGYQILAVAITYFIIGLSFTFVAILGEEGEGLSMVAKVFTCIVGAVIAPVFEAKESILGAVITFFGLLQASQLNRKVKLDITGPHALAPAAAQTSSPSA
jgi:hypothetical protein